MLIILPSSNRSITESRSISPAGSAMFIGNRSGELYDLDLNELSFVGLARNSISTVPDE